MRQAHQGVDNPNRKVTEDIVRWIKEDLKN